MEKINTAVAALKKSPLFNLSLASKELFHSNFLAWVLEKKDDQARILLHELAGKKDFVLETLVVTREENNFDLTLMVKDHSGNQCRIVIENKVKSIPSQAQLNGYSVKLIKNPKGVDETITILLSLTTPEFFKGAECYKPAQGGPAWRYFGYAELLDCLNHGKSEDPYHEALLTDYKNFVRNLIDLQAAIQGAFDGDSGALINPFDWPRKKDKSLYSELKTIRMHDIFEKWRMLAIQEKLMRMVREKDAEVLNRLTISSGFTNGLGLLEIWPEGKHQNSFFKIQLQGTQLRQVLQKDTAGAQDEVFKQAERLLKDSQWFRARNGDQLPECGAEENYHFCKYGRGFVYRHEQLKDIPRLSDLVMELGKNPFPAER